MSVCSKLPSTVMVHEICHIDYNSTYFLILEYTMELSITPEERVSLKALQDLSGLCQGLCNDYWSWPREREAHVTGKSRLMNAVLVAMKQHDLPAHKALAFVRDLTLQKEQELIDMRNKLLSAGNLSRDMRMFIDGHLWMVGGNDLWESTCRRYNKHLYFDLNATPPPRPQSVPQTSQTSLGARLRALGGKIRSWWRRRGFFRHNGWDYQISQASVGAKHIFKGVFDNGKPDTNLWPQIELINNSIWVLDFSTCWRKGPYISS